MTRSTILRLGVSGFGLLGLALCGCEHQGCFLRRQAQQTMSSGGNQPTAFEAMANEGPANPEADVTADLAQHAKGFFKGGRRQGAWSSEANEIEADLGVTR